MWSWVFPGLMTPVLALLRGAVLTEWWMYPWAYPAFHGVLPLTLVSLLMTQSHTAQEALT